MAILVFELQRNNKIDFIGKNTHHCKTNIVIARSAPNLKAMYNHNMESSL